MKNAASITTAVLSLAFAGAALSQGAPAAPAAPGNSAHVEFKSVDANSDGRISQSEAQSHTELNSKFATLDADRDTYLSNSEYAKWSQTGKAGDAMPADAGKASPGNAPRSESAEAPQADAAAE